MLNSRSIDRLRPDVAANCRIWQQRCQEAGLAVLVTGTVRDDEYQQYCYKNGTAATPIPSFHSVKAGLAFDFCKNVKGHEYDDPAFFSQAAAIAKEMGFEWGGDWKSFPDRPHLQWSEGGRYTSSMIRSGRYPPAMPLYSKEEDMTQEEFNRMMDVYLAQNRDKPASGWAKDIWEKGQAAGIFDGSAPQNPLTREQAALMLDRLGLI